MSHSEAIYFSIMSASQILFILNIFLALDSSFSTVHIWSKAAIGSYLWEHILRGRIEHYDGISEGYKTIEGVQFAYLWGRKLLPSFVTPEILNDGLVLVLNGRDANKMIRCRYWLDSIQSSIKQPEHSFLGVVLLGSENCDNDWILPYMHSKGGPIRFLFVVYDWEAVDDEEIFQWPLGVATYRGFPNPNPTLNSLRNSRPYLCNFLGTVYPNSTRTELMDQLQYRKDCFIKGRTEWEPHESQFSLSQYVHALELSDLTLNPQGMNPECYRIYEALSLGSIPIVEMGKSPQSGSKCSTESLRLLRGAPIPKVMSWTREVTNILYRFSSLFLDEKIARRIETLQWYEGFKDSTKKRFHRVVCDKFLLKCNV